MGGVPVSQGLAPWVILADGPGGLICVRICPGRLSRRWYATTSGRVGQEGGGGRLLGLSLHLYIAADLRAPVPSGEREPEPACRVCRAVARWYSVNRNTLTRPGQYGQRAGASADVAPKFVHKSAVCLLRPG